jgi:hypothetical protein
MNHKYVELKNSCTVYKKVTPFYPFRYDYLKGGMLQRKRTSACTDAADNDDASSIDVTLRRAALYRIFR